MNPNTPDLFDKLDAAADTLTMSRPTRGFFIRITIYGILLLLLIVYLVYTNEINKDPEKRKKRKKYK
jgi:uncharacterized ion transporter superfamily protein YfcC